MAWGSINIGGGAGGSKIQVAMITLPEGSLWDDNGNGTYSILSASTGIDLSSDDLAQLITVTPRTNYYNAYQESGIRCLGVENGTQLYFECDSPPSASIDVYVAVQEVG